MNVWPNGCLTIRKCLLVETKVKKLYPHLKEKEHKKLASYKKNPDSSYKKKSLWWPVELSYLIHFGYMNKMRGNVTPNHRTVYIRRDIWILYSPEPSDCSGPHPTQFWASPIMEISQPLNNLCQCSITHTVKIFLAIQSEFPKVQVAAVASDVSPVQEKPGSIPH